MSLELDSYDYRSEDIDIEDIVEAKNIDVPNSQREWHFVKDPKRLVPNNGAIRRIAVKLVTGTATLLKSFLIDSVILVVRPEIAIAKGVKGYVNDVKNMAKDVRSALSSVDLSEKAIDNIVVYIYLSHYYFFSFFRGISPTSSIAGQILTDDDNDCYLNVLDELENNHKNSTFYSNHILFSFGRLITDFKKKDLLNHLELFEQNAIHTISILLKQYDTNGSKIIERLQNMDMIREWDNISGKKLTIEEQQKLADLQEKQELKGMKDLVEHNTKLIRDLSKYMYTAKKLHTLIEYHIDSMKPLIDKRNRIASRHKGKDNYRKRRELVERMVEKEIGEEKLLLTIITWYNQIAEIYLYLSELSKELLSDIKLHKKFESISKSLMIHENPLRLLDLTLLRIIT